MKGIKMNNTLRSQPARQALAIAYKINRAKDWNGKCKAVHKWHECVIKMLAIQN
jgi:hypothetical protein